MALRGVVVLAGGENTRLRPLSLSVYKAFVPIHGLSIAARHILRAQMAGATHVAVLVDEYDPAISAILEDSRADATVELYTVPGSPATKILHAASRFPDWRPLPVVLGDTIARVDLKHLIESPARLQMDSAICASRYRLPFGLVTIEGQAVVDFVEKPKLEYLVNTGYMALGDMAMRLLEGSGDLGRTLQELSDRRQLGLSAVVENFVTVDDLGSLAEAHVSMGGEDDPPVTLHLSKPGP